MISSYSWEVYRFVVTLRQMKPTKDDQVPKFVILKIDEDILGDSKMKINTFIYTNCLKLNLLTSLENSWEQK